MHVYNLAIVDFEIPEGEMALLDRLTTPGEMEINTIHLYYVCIYITWPSLTLWYRRGRWHCSRAHHARRDGNKYYTSLLYIHIYNLALFDFEIPEGEVALLDGLTTPGEMEINTIHLYYVCIYITYNLAIFDFVIPEGEMALLEGSPRNVRWKQTRNQRYSSLFGLGLGLGLGFGLG